LPQKRTPTRKRSATRDFDNPGGVWFLDLVPGDVPAGRRSGGFSLTLLQEMKQLNIMATEHARRIIQPYLFFNGTCEQAVEFYRKALGAQVDFTMRYKESPEAPPPGMVPPGWEDKIMHTSFRIGETTVMASDGCSADKASFDSFSLSLSVGTETEADRAFAALADGGQVKMPLTKTFWSPRFGMLTDRFGLSWMISVPGPVPA
jgi:PhnB protein